MFRRCFSLLFAAAAFPAAAQSPPPEFGTPLLLKRVAIPESLCTSQEIEGESRTFGGDLRIGDLTGDGHIPNIIVVDTKGNIRNRLDINSTPNNRGMETVYWNGNNKPALLCNGDTLWNPLEGAVATFPDLPAPSGPRRAGWYHCIPANLCGDKREEVLLYNPWDAAFYIFTPAPFDPDAYDGYQPGPRQYNARLMD